jgi:hypothetical protein
MNATIAERLINHEHISDEQTRIDGFIFDRMWKWNPPMTAPSSSSSMP